MTVRSAVLSLLFSVSVWAICSPVAQAQAPAQALFDGIWLGVSTARKEAVNQHRAMIIITDGGDNHSRYNLAETRRLLEEADVPAFAVMAGPSFEFPAIFLPQEKKQKGAKPQLPSFLA